MNVYQSILLTKRAFKGEVVPGGTPDPEPPPVEDYDFTVSNDAEMQAAMLAAGPGDVIGMMSGTYRNTYTPTNSGTVGLPITIEPVVGQTPIVSGFNEIGTTGWTVHSGNIYKKTITLPVNGFNTSTTRVFGVNNNNTTIYANQILRNDEMMFEARWPKIGSIADLMTWTKYRQLSYPTFAPTSLTDATLPLTSGLVGATIVSNGWFQTEARTITSHSGSTIGYGSIWGATGTSRWPRKAYYVTGKLALLTQAKEWHYENGTLYMWQDGGGTPSGTLEYKARNWGFNLRGKSHIVIKGLTFRGCDPVVMNTSDTNITIDRTKAKYNNHYVRHDVGDWPGFGMSRMFGTKLIGSNCKFTNNEWEVMGNGVWLGENALAHNNLMHDIGYVGNWAQPFSLWDEYNNQTLTYNTIYNCGRSCIDFGFNVSGGEDGQGNSQNVTIAYNNMYNYGMISADVGATYAWGQRVTTGLNYHHNWIHDCLSRVVIGEGGTTAGIYFDQATGGGRIHHNLVWNVPNADMYHEVTNEHRTTNTRFDIYNNVFYSANGIEPGADSSYRTYITSPLERQRSNIYNRKIVINWAAGYVGDTTNSVLPGTNPQFTGTSLASQQGLYFQIGASSPARGIGLASFTGNTGAITDGSSDAGAYPYGDPDPWVPGYTAIVDNPETPTEFYIDNVSTANVYTGVWTHVNNASWTQEHINKTISFSYEVGATLITSFTGNKVEWWTEKRINHGIVAVSVDGGAETMVDLYEDRTDNVSQMVFSAIVPLGNHTIKLRLTATPNPSATENNAMHDAFKIYTEATAESVLATGVWNNTAYYDNDAFYKNS